LASNTMIFIRGLLLALIAAGFWFIPCPAGTDIGPFRLLVRGGTVAPQAAHQSIRLDSQEIIIRLKRGSYVVDAVFDLFNTGETATEQIGFPKWVVTPTGSFPTFIRFEGSVNGEPITFNEEWDASGGSPFLMNLLAERRLNLASRPMKEERRWLVRQVTFPGHGKTIIRVTYEAPYSVKHYREASFVYGTGSLWKGSIGKTVFIIDSTNVGGPGNISIYFEKGPWPEPVSESVKFGRRPILGNVQRCEITHFKPHPEAYLRIKLAHWFGIKPNYVRMKPMPPPPPMPERVKK
jgi:hypothetical protein